MPTFYFNLIFSLHDVKRFISKADDPGALHDYINKLSVISSKQIISSIRFTDKRFYIIFKLRRVSYSKTQLIIRRLDENDFAER